MKEEYLELGIEKVITPEMKTLEDEIKKEDKKKLNWWTKAFKTKNFKKPNLVAVLFLRNNGRAEALQLESKNGFFSIARKTYHERKDCTWIVGKDRIPLAIIPEWSLIPLGTKEWQDKTMLEKFNELQDHTLKGIRHAELVKEGMKDFGNIPMKKVIMWGIIILIVGIIFVNYI